MVELGAGERIRDATIEMLETKGFIGLRIADVAARAKVSSALIYKYYGDREDLIAQVMGDLLTEFYARSLAVVERYLATETKTVDFEALVRAFPIPSNDVARRQRWMRVQVFAAAHEIPELKKRLQTMHTEFNQVSESLALEIRRRTGAKGHFDARVFRQMVNANIFGLILNDVDETPLTDEEYVPFMTDMLKRYLS